MKIWDTNKLGQSTSHLISCFIIPSMNSFRVGTSVTWPKAIFSKILNLKPIAKLAAIPWKTISGTYNYIQIPQAVWPEVVVKWTLFERQNILVRIFRKANLSGFGTWKFTTKQDLNPQKLVFLLNLRLWTAQKLKICPIFYGEKFI